MKIAPENRPQAAGVYTKYREPFLSGIAGAKSKDLLVRAEDVQVLHGFDLRANAESYLGSALFQHDPAPSGASQTYRCFCQHLLLARGLLTIF